MRPALLLAAVVALPVPVAHAAATVSATSRTVPDYGGVSTAFRVVATGDQAGDQLRATGIYGDFHLALGVLVSDDNGAVAQAGCEQLDATSVRCMVPTQQIGDATISAALDGGPGDDVLHASDVARSLTGAEGDDVLDAHDKADATLAGGPGADRLIGPARDTGPRGGVTFDGGPGPDVMVGYGTVTYAGRVRPVHVDLRNRGPVQGEVGEGDTIENARIVYGGRGSDTLVAAGPAVRFFGGAGRDRLTGGRGRDLLEGGAGADAFNGVGRGDTVRARDGQRDVVRCRRHPRRVTVDRLDVVLGCGGGRIVRRQRIGAR